MAIGDPFKTISVGDASYRVAQCETLHGPEPSCRRLDNRPAMRQSGI